VSGPAGARSAGPGVAEPGSAVALERRIERQAYALGFDLVGFVQLGPAESAAHFDEWLARGCEGEMHYMARDAHVRRDTRLPHPGAVSAIVVGMDYGGAEPSGPVARYARGDDYHDVMRDRLRQLHAWLAHDVGREIDARPYVDTAPILERDLARRAGLGWFGKNTMLINPARGSYFFIGSLFVALELEASEPFDADRCGSCTRCLEACPTDAFDGPRQLDARKCVSYLTIEHRSAIPEALREGVGDRIYGCDVCQEVCPWNVKFARELRVDEFRPRALLAHSDATDGVRARARELLVMEQADYAAAFRGSAIKRAKLWMLKRNACVVLGNIGTAEDLPTLQAMTADMHEEVRKHAARAVARIDARNSERRAT
jgi:epoxyqueuosine reductase